MLWSRGRVCTSEGDRQEHGGGALVRGLAQRSGSVERVVNSLWRVSRWKDPVGGLQDYNVLKHTAQEQNHQ